MREVKEFINRRVASFIDVATVWGVEGGTTKTTVYTFNLQPDDSETFFQQQFSGCQ